MANNSLEHLLVQKEQLELQIKEIQKEKRAEAILQIYNLMETTGLEFEDLTKKPRKPYTKSTKSVSPKYQKDDFVWSGRGMKPVWVREYLEEGGTLEELLIKKE